VGISAIANGSFLYWGLRRKGIYTPKPGRARLFGICFLANLVMGGLLYYLAGPLNQWLVWHAWYRALYLSFIIVLGAMVYFAVLIACGLRKRDFVH
jgi:putative peptidoglycan lipid II flippase